MKKILTLIVVVFIGTAAISCRSSKKNKKLDKLDEKTKKYWRWNSSTGGEW